MMVLRPRQGNVKLVFRLFVSYSAKPRMRLNNLKTCLRFPCLGLNIIDNVSIIITILNFIYKIPVSSQNGRKCPRRLGPCVERIWSVGVLHNGIKSLASTLSVFTQSNRQFPRDFWPEVKELKLILKVESSKAMILLWFMFEHPPSLIRAFAVRSVGSQGLIVFSYGQRKLWIDCADAQADLSLHWAHISFCWFCHVRAHLSLKSPWRKFTVRRDSVIIAFALISRCVCGGWGGGGGGTGGTQIFFG